MRNWISKKRISLISLLLGGCMGFLYWKYIGCSTGTCPIKSHWHTMTLYGLIMGWLVGDLIGSYFSKKKQDRSRSESNQP